MGPPRTTFAGGMQRIDMTEAGCRTIWRTRVPSSAVPKLSRAEDVRYTVTRRGVLPRYQVARISPSTGEILSETETPLSAGPLADTLQMVGTILKDGTLMQGSLSGLTAVPPR